MLKYGLRYRVTMIPGDGIGKELCRSVEQVFKAYRVPIDFELIPLSGYTSTSVEEALTSLRKNRVGLKGIIYTNPIGEARSINVMLRKELDLYANVVKIVSMAGVPSRYQNLDIVLIRENIEGEYSGLEHEPVAGVVESLKVSTRDRCRKISRFAFDYALKHGRGKITCVHKANIMKMTDGLFLKTFQEIATEYHPKVISESMIVDNAAMQMVSNPEQFDVIVTSNLYGNVLSNIGAGLLGSAGLLPGYNLGRDFVIFEPGARHVGKDIEGRNVANPVSILLSSVLMLKHLGLEEYAQQIKSSVMKVLSTGKMNTPDIKDGTCSTSEFTQAVIDEQLLL